MLQLIVNGGPWAFIILGLTGLSLFFSLAALVVSVWRGKMPPLIAWVSFPTLILLVGHVGTWVASGSLAGAEHQRQFAEVTAHTLNLELLTTLCAWFSCFAGATVVSFSGLVGSVSSSAGRKPTPIAAVLSFVLGGLVMGAIGLTSMGLGGTVVILLNVVLIWAVAVCVGVNLLKEVEGSRHAQRRFHVAVLVGFGMCTFAVFAPVINQLEMFEALEKAYVHKRVALMVFGLELAELDRNVAIKGAAGSLLFGFLPAMLYIRELFERRAAIDILSAVFVALFAILGVLGLNSLAEARHEAAVPGNLLTLRYAVPSVGLDELELPEEIQTDLLEPVLSGDCLLNHRDTQWFLGSSFRARDACDVGACESGVLKELCPEIERPLLLIPSSFSALELAQEEWLEGRKIVLGLNQHLEDKPSNIPSRYLHFVPKASGIEMSFLRGEPRPETAVVPAEGWTIKKLVEACLISAKKTRPEAQPLSCEVWLP